MWISILRCPNDPIQETVHSVYISTSSPSFRIQHCFSFCYICLSHVKMFYSMNVFLISLWVSVFAYHKDVEEMLWLPALLFWNSSITGTFVMAGGKGMAPSKFENCSYDLLSLKQFLYSYTVTLKCDVFFTLLSSVLMFWITTCWRT